MGVTMSGRPGTQARRFGVAILVLALAPLRLAAQERAADVAVPGPLPGTEPDAGPVDAAAMQADAGVANPGPSDLDGGSMATAAPDAGTATSRQQPPPKRALPEYDGREPPTGTAGDALLVVPRLVLLPLYLVAEYAVARPVGALAETAERNDWPKSIHDFFTFGPNDEAGLFPTFLVDFGLRPSIGAHFYWDFKQARNRFSADIAFGGAQWWTVAIADRQEFSPFESLVAELRWDRRPDSLFYGIGPEVSDMFRSRVGTDVLRGSLTWDRVLGQVSLRARGSVRRLDFKDFTCCGDPALKQRVEAGELPPPPGYEESYTAATADLTAVLDTRRPDRPSQSGWRVGLGAAPSVDLQTGGRKSWFRYAAAVEGNWDVTGTGRVVSLGLSSAFVDPLGSEPVPFTELVALGGNEPFAGFLPGRLLDRSALVATLGWHWPVFSYLDGLLAVSFGNVFGPHLEEFSFDLLRLSAEIGMRTRGTGGSGFQFVIGMGTEPFREHLRVSSFRLAFGLSYGP